MQSYYFDTLGENFSRNFFIFYINWNIFQKYSKSLQLLLKMFIHVNFEIF